MEKTIIRFGDIEIEKQKFHQHKRPISIKIVGIHKVVVYNKASFGKKCFKNFIGYKDAEKYIPLYIFLPKTIAYRKDFDKLNMYLF